MPDLAEIKTRARQAIHKAAAVPALYYPPVDGSEGVSVTVRWHNRIDTTGDLDGSYGTQIEGVERLIFHTDNLNDPTRLAPVVLAHAGEVVIPGYGNAIFSLDALEPNDGPGEVIWTVARLKTRQIA